MRELKFRVWDEHIGWMQSFTLFELFDRTAKLMFTVHAEFMQYTGLRDKNGVEIYEGDIVQMDDIITGSVWPDPGFVFGEEDRVYIAWDPSVAAWSIGGDDFDADDRASVAYRNQVIQLIHDQQAEVIGNIYENPELLK